MNSSLLTQMTAADLGIPLFPGEAIPHISPSAHPHGYVPYCNVKKEEVTHWLVQMHTGNLHFYLNGCTMKGSPDAINRGDPRKMIVHHLSYDVGTIEPLWGERPFWQRVDRMKEFGVHTVIAPDFSAWADYPIVVQLNNLYRSAMVARDLARVGFKVIPNVTWSIPVLTNISFSIWPKDATLLLVDATHVNTKRLSINQEIFWDGARAFKAAWPRVTPWLWASSPKVVAKWRQMIGDCVWCPSRVYVLGQLQKMFQQQENRTEPATEPAAAIQEG